MTPVISFVGYSGSGKTTLIEKLIIYLSSLGFKVGTIKHTHHKIELDKEGKDSYRHFHSGAVSSMIVSEDKIGFVSRVIINDTNILANKFFSDCDVVIVEGFKDDDTIKIEVFRNEAGKEPLYKRLQNVIAMATDVNFPDIICLDINNTALIAHFLIKKLALKKGEA